MTMTPAVRFAELSDVGKNGRPFQAKGRAKMQAWMPQQLRVK
jgi:hypothetical protein